MAKRGLGSPLVMALGGLEKPPEDEVDDFDAEESSPVTMKIASLSSLPLIMKSGDTDD